MAMASVIRPPAPSPWRARNAISSPSVWATPLSAEPARKTTIAAWNRGLRPWRSLTRPQMGIETVAPRRYAVTTHESWSIPPRSPTIVGSAVATIVWSSEASSIASSRPAKVSAVRLSCMTDNPSVARSLGESYSSYKNRVAITLLRLYTPGAMAVGLRERKKEQTRERIAQVARDLFLARGFENVTVAEVARAAEVAQKTVFNYFPTKEDLFYWRMETFED